MENVKYINGVALRHAYTLLQTFEFQKDDQKVRLVKMRNPWGISGEWQGDWGD